MTLDLEQHSVICTPNKGIPWKLEYHQMTFASYFCKSFNDLTHFLWDSFQLTHPFKQDMKKKKFQWWLNSLNECELCINLVLFVILN